MIFLGITRSCLKQITTAPRKSAMGSADARRGKAQELEKELNKIENAEHFVTGFIKCFSQFCVKRNRCNL